MRDVATMVQSVTRRLVGLVAAAVLLLAAAGWSNGHAFGDQFVPFAMPGEPNPVSLIARTAEPIGVDSPRVEVSGGHFARDGQRLRIWGVNTSFGANFPTHAEAERMARRLAAAGVNSVRLHHMDTASWPSGLWDPVDGATVYAPAIERLDYFIDQLAQRGIWVNLNLHVGRVHSQDLGLPDPGTGYDKIVGIFTPALIVPQKRFASTLLNHVNAYRGARYADDSAIAFVEITNEDSFFMWNGDASLRNLPPYYAAILQNQYNAWLVARYGSRTALEAAWADGVEPLGANQLINGDFQSIGSGGFPTNWNLEQHGESRASATVTQYASVDGLRLDVANDDGTDWHLQINQPGLAVDAGRYYTVTFDAAAAAPRTITASVMQAHDPWQNLGVRRSVAPDFNWQSYRLGFHASSGDANARVNFAFGGATPSVYLANVQLRPGGQQGLLAGEDPAVGNVALFVDAPGNAREADRLRFLAETEKNYFDAMLAYVKNSLGCNALVTGTIVFGPLGLYAQRDMDFIDAHAYWRHPSFPNAPWDPNDWLVEQDAMSDDPAGATLFALAAQRLADKPFTITEYNHSAPNDYQAECVPMIASFAAAQDWDGIWIYSYAHSADIWDDAYFNSFFDIANNPAKFGFMPAGAAIFGAGGVTPLAPMRTVNLAPSGDALSDAVTLRSIHGDDMWRIVRSEASLTWSDLLAERCQVAFGPGGSPTGESATTMDWAVSPDGGVFSAVGENAWAFTGRADRFAAGTQGRITITAPEFVAVTVTALDDRPFERSRELLVTACGRSENTNMVFSTDRRTVHTDWGEAPVRIEAVDGTLQLPPGRWTGTGLAADGSAHGTVDVSHHDGQGTLPLAAANGTMWYRLDRAIGDADGDGDIDNKDFSSLVNCLSGPQAPLSTGCEAFDLSADNDVDLEDFTLFQQAYTGPSD